MLRLPRNLHFKVHKVLCLPRNLHFEVHKVLCLPRNLHFEVHKVLRLPRNLHFEVHHMLCFPRNLALRGSQGDKVLHPPRFLKTTHMSKTKFTARVTLERVKDHHHVQNAAPATKSAVRSTTAPIRCTCHQKSTLHRQNTRCPLRLPRKVIIMSENAHGVTTRAQSRQAPAPANQILQACAVEMHFEDFERYECTVHGSELAGHGCATPR